MSPEHLLIMEQDQSIFDENLALRTDYEKRITDALYEPPIDGILAVNGQLLPFYQELDWEVNNACMKHDTCNHGFDNHLKHMAKNVLTLSSIVDEGIYKDGRTLLQKGSFSERYSDAMSITPVLLHDVVYRIKGIQWNGYSINNHEKIAVRYLEKMRNNILPKLINLDDNRVAISCDTLDKLSPLYLKTIGYNTKELIYDTEQLTHSKIITPEMLFPSIVMLGDKLEYYHEGRLKELKEKQNNLYFRYAKHVKKYFISHAPGVICFNVELDGMSFPAWYKGTQDLYPEIWELGSIFAKVLGREFRVQEVSKAT